MIPGTFNQMKRYCFLIPGQMSVPIFKYLIDWGREGRGPRTMLTNNTPENNHGRDGRFPRKILAELKK